MSSPPAQVLIVGAGPTGLTLAIELTRRGIPPRIIDRLEEPLPWERATALLPRVLELLEDLGILDRFLERGLRQPTAAFHVGTRRIAELSLKGLETRFPFVLGMDEATIEHLLEEHLDSLGLSVERGTPLAHLDLDADSIEATIEGPEGTEHLSPDWLVSCEGAHSSVRHAVGDPFDGFTYPRKSFAMDARFEGWPFPESEIVNFLGHDTAGAEAVAPGVFRVWSFLDGDPAPEDVDIAGILERNAGSGISIVEESNRTVFTLQNRMAASFRYGRALLAGDAAHVCSPLSASGMNAGMLDAANLAWKLAAVSAGADARLLDTYDTERRGAARDLLDADRELVMSLLLEDPAEVYERNRLVAIDNADPTTMAASARSFAKLDVAYEPGPIATGPTQEPRRGPVPGSRMPDVGPLVYPDGSEVSTQDLCMGTHHQVLLLAAGQPDRAAAPLARLVQRAARSPELRVACIVPSSVELEPLPADCLRDPGWRAHDRLGVIGAELIVVRHDGHIGVRCGTTQLEPLDAYLRWCLPAA